MITSYYSTSIQIGQIYINYTHNIKLQVKSWKTYYGESQITLDVLDEEFKPTGKESHINSSNWGSCKLVLLDKLIKF